MYNTAAGLAFAFAATYGVSKTITSTTNANPAVSAFATGHAIAVGDVFVIDSHDWEPLEEVVHRAVAVAADNISLEDIDTTNLTFYPAGGAGTAREILTWTSIKGIIGQKIDGDEQGFETITPLGRFGRQIKIPTDRTPTEIELTLSHNVVSQTWYKALVALDGAVKTKTALRAVWPDGMRLFCYGYVSVKRPPMQDGMNSPKGTIKFTGNVSVFGT